MCVRVLIPVYLLVCVRMHASVHLKWVRTKIEGKVHTPQVEHFYQILQDEAENGLFRAFVNRDTGEAAEQPHS